MLTEKSRSAPEKQGTEGENEDAKDPARLRHG